MKICFNQCLTPKNNPMLCQNLQNVLKLMPLGFYQNILHGLFYESSIILIIMSPHLLLGKLTAEQNQWNLEMLKRL